MTTYEDQQQQQQQQQQPRQEQHRPDQRAEYRIAPLLRSAAALAVPVVRDTADEELGAPTPCAEYDVRGLLNHLFRVVENFRLLAAKQPSDFSGADPDRLAGPEWRKRFEEETGLLVDAWSAPGAEEGTTGAMDLPARTVGAMVLLDLTVHVWDLARATGRAYEPDPAVVTALTGEVAGMAPTARAMGVFGAEVELPEGASAFERLLAVTGRDPRTWAAAL
ncbi:TIGR03086 family metal-binding protein [Streptomyces roseicoloratus]|uniref:TIGR03086 family metal-binding protein n=1 Tax=Streptomyces roseicoloratus TaxID=2508722 RepID=A0ABY9RWF6_9ACTN|nr:TIGR03086 family metal-binding protein [Streptomyces roseicoloratus]WMX46512.1 TIGR03086 family metal-binding protein [Streptomyces roseicoloratus]